MLNYLIEMVSGCLEIVRTLSLYTVCMMSNVSLYCIVYWPVNTWIWKYGVICALFAWNSFYFLTEFHGKTGNYIWILGGFLRGLCRDSRETHIRSQSPPEEFLINVNNFTIFLWWCHAVWLFWTDLIWVQHDNTSEASWVTRWGDD